MKILFHIPAKFIGGAERQIQYLLKYLADIVKEDDWSPFITYESQAVLPVFRDLDVRTTAVVTRKDLVTTLERVKPDIFQFYTSPLCYRALLALTFRPKVIEVIHNKNQFKGDATSYPKDRTDITVCVSDDAKKFISSHFKNLDTFVIKNGVDDEFFVPKPSDRSATPVVGYAGRLCKDKGIDRLIALAPRFDCPLELVGQDFNKYTARDHPNVRILAQTEAPETYYRAWWGTVSASPHESFGMTIAESLACNTPVVMLDCGGITTYLEHGKHALIAKTEDELVSYVNGLVKGQYELAPTEAHFSARDMAQSYLRLYRTLLRQPQRKVAAVLSPEPPSGTAKIFTPIAKPINVPGGALGVTPRAWYGVVRSFTSYCNHYAEPQDAIAAIAKVRPRFVVLGCYQDDWQPICDAAHKAGALVVATWHASYILNEFHAINRTWMAQMLKAYKTGYIDHLATPHQGLAESWTYYGYKTSYFPNVVDELPAKVKKLFGINIGILGSGQNWKNMECQIVAAGMIKGARIHVQEVQGSEVIDRLGIKVTVHPKTLTDEEYYALVGGMTVNLCISMSEVYSYLTAESFMMETPVVTSSITPVLRHEGQPHFAEVCCGTPYFEDPMAIARKIKAVIGAKDVIGPRLRVHMRSVNQDNRFICEEVIGSWT